MNDKATLFSEIFYSRFRSTEQNEQWGVDFYGDSHLDFGPVPATNYWNPFGVALASVYYELPELGGVDYTAGDIDTWRVVGGVRGDLGPLSYEVAATYFWNDQAEILGQLLFGCRTAGGDQSPGPSGPEPVLLRMQYARAGRGHRCFAAAGDGQSRSPSSMPRSAARCVKRDSY